MEEEACKAYICTLTANTKSGNTTEQRRDDRMDGSCVEGINPNMAALDLAV
jgi:hypothetical protein